jgi:hypothetical protein
MIKKLLLLLILNIFSLSCISQIRDKRDESQKYIDAHIKGIPLYNDNKLLQDKIIKILSTKEHTYRFWKDSTNRKDEGYLQIYDLSRYQNIIIFLMLIRLKDTLFLNTIGKIIKEDVKDVYSESGGIIIFDKSNKLYCKCFKSEKDYLRDEIFNNTYYIPEKTNFISKVTYFHLHASTYNEKKYAGPSPLDLMHSSFPFPNNMINEFVITSIEKGIFNIDYYGLDVRVGELEPSPGVKIIDLGNYKYK